MICYLTDQVGPSRADLLRCPSLVKCRARVSVQMLSTVSTALQREKEAILRKVDGMNGGLPNRRLGRLIRLRKNKPPRENPRQKPDESTHLFE